MQWLWNKYLFKHSNEICSQNILFLLDGLKLELFSLRMKFSDLIKTNFEAYKRLAPVYFGTKEPKKEEKRYYLLSTKSSQGQHSYVCVKRDKSVKH